MLEILLSQTVSGLVLGGLYVLIAIGLSIIFGLLGIVNFAHGAFFTLGAYFALTLVELFGWPAVLLSPIIVGGIGMVAERLLIRRLYDKEPLISLIVTFALALLIEAAVGYPDQLFRAIGHPVTWIGRMIGILDRTLNHDGASNASRRWAGAVALLIVIAAAGAAGFVVGERYRHEIRYRRTALGAAATDRVR